MSSLSPLKIKQLLFASIVVSYKISLCAAAAVGKQLLEQFQGWAQGGKSQAVGSVPCGYQKAWPLWDGSLQLPGGKHQEYLMCLVPCVMREGEQHFA